VDHRFGVIPTAFNVDRHFEAPARSAGLEGCYRSAQAVALRGSLRSHLRVTGMSHETAQLASMPEVPRARKHHGDAVIVGSLDHLVVAH
jgi:hypothetical protein